MGDSLRIRKKSGNAAPPPFSYQSQLFNIPGSISPFNLDCPVRAGRGAVAAAHTHGRRHEQRRIKPLLLFQQIVRTYLSGRTNTVGWITIFGCAGGEVNDSVFSHSHRTRSANFPFRSRLLMWYSVLSDRT